MAQLSRRAIGLGLLGLGVGATAAIGFADFERIGSLVSGRPLETTNLWGFLGGEKSPLMAAENVRALLRDRYGLVVDARRAGSVEQVSEPALLSQKPDFLWPSSSVLVEIAKANGVAVRKDVVIFNSPIVVYTWRPIATAFEKAGLVRREPSGFLSLDLPALVEMIRARRTWAELGVDLFGAISWTSTDPTRSNSGFMFAGLLANVLTGDVATGSQLPSVMPDLVDLFERMGYKEHSSGKLFEGYLNEGMGGKPIVVGYENQLIEFAAAAPETYARIAGGVLEPVTLYPRPSVYSAHPLISIAPAADRLIEAMQDKDIQAIAWRQHGFRGPLGTVDISLVPIPGLPETAPSIIAMPGGDTMNTILAAMRS